MAEANSILNIIVRLHDEASQKLQGFTNRLSELEPQFRTMRNIGVVGFAAVTGAIALTVSQANEAEAAFNRLNHILKTSRHATDAQVASLVEQAKALEKVGVVSQDSIIQAQAQLATFDLNTDSIKRLTPAILDYVVAEKGANASTEDLKQLTNGLAQALNGNFASLTRTGFVLDEATKNLIENGTEAERTAALVKVLNSTYEGFNAAARNTAEGGMVALKNEFNNMRQSIGEALLPIINSLTQALLPLIAKISAWVKEHQGLTAAIVIVTGVLFALAAILGTIGLILPGIITAFGLFTGGIALLTGTVGILIAVVVGLGAWFIWLWNNSDKVVNGLKAGWEGFKNFFIEIWTRIKENFSAIWEGIKGVFQSAIDWMMAKLQPLISAIEAVKNGFSFVTSNIKAAGQIIGQNVSAAAKAIGFADGGIVTRPTLGLVGEAGPEAIIPLSQMGRMGGVIINIYGDVSGEDLITKVKEGLMRSLRQDSKISL